MAQTCNEYTVCLLFTENLSRMLLKQMPATATKMASLNGLGGKVGPGETLLENALRKIWEDTALPDDMRDTSISTLTWLGTLSLPEDCKTGAAAGSDPAAPACVLHYYAAVKNEAFERHIKHHATKPLMLTETNTVLFSRVTDPTWAHSGNLQYFTHLAVQKLR